EHGNKDDVFNVELLQAEGKIHPDQLQQHRKSFLTSSAGYGAIHSLDGHEDVEIKQGRRLEKESKKVADRDKIMRAANKVSGFPKQRASKPHKKKDEVPSNVSELIIYSSELENQVQFEGFRDWLHTFQLYRGKNTGNHETDENRVVGKFKGSMKIYQIPLPSDIEDCVITGGEAAYGLFQGLPSNEPVKVLVRVYIVK
ncbi:unnamed protein product, partial [Candidula unifasciata]